MVVLWCARNAMMLENAFARNKCVYTIYINIHTYVSSQRGPVKLEGISFIYSFFFFRLFSLFSYQMNQVLDAMFERKVSAGEIVIRQGDDGDNFYVIES